MTRHLLATTLALATLAHAQTTVVDESSTQTDPIEVTSRPTDDVPNMSEPIEVSTTVIDDSTIPVVISAPLTTIPISSVSNHINGNNTYTGTVPTSAGPNSCVTVTMQGEPMFTIQTDTVFNTPCTYTVYGGASSGSADISSDVLTTTSTTGTSSDETTIITGTSSMSPSTTAPPDSSESTASESSAPATQSDGAANRVGMGAESLGLVAFIGALGLL